MEINNNIIIPIINKLILKLNEILFKLILFNKNIPKKIKANTKPKIIILAFSIPNLYMIGKKIAITIIVPNKEPKSLR